MQLYSELKIKPPAKAVRCGCVVCGVEPLSSELDESVWAALGKKLIYVCKHCDHFEVESQHVLDQLFKQQTKQ